MSLPVHPVCKCHLISTQLPFLKKPVIAPIDYIYLFNLHHAPVASQPCHVLCTMYSSVEA